MLELGDAELEFPHRVARRDPELFREPRRGVGGRVADAARFPAPAVDRVRERGAHVVGIHSDAARELVGQLVHPPRRQRERADSG